MSKLVFVIGTRPEAIKLAPVIRAAAGDPRFESVVIATAQHRELLDQALGWFGIRVDHDLALMKPNQQVHEVLARALPRLVTLLAAEKPEWVVAQGDTTTTFCAALAGYYQQVLVAHVEAGLRTGDLYAPFPEEANRHLTDVLAHHCFAPTEQARANLRAEGVPGTRITVTGNTGIDALFALSETGVRVPEDLASLLDSATRMVLVTAHRRESFGPPLQSICRALRRLVRDHPDVSVVFPVHPNPHVQQEVRRQLGECARVRLLPPLPYPVFVHLLQRATLVLTDSGGVQEEAPAFGTPVLVLRDVTERPEGVAAGVAVLVGTDEERILTQASRLLHDPAARAAMARRTNPYGDGKATGRILDVLRNGGGPGSRARQA